MVLNTVQEEKKTYFYDNVSFDRKACWRMRMEHLLGFHFVNLLWSFASDKLHSEG